MNKGELTILTIKKQKKLISNADYLNIIEKASKTEYHFYSVFFLFLKFFSL